MARSIRRLSGQFTDRPRTKARHPTPTRTAGVHHFVSSRNRHPQALPWQRSERNWQHLSATARENKALLSQTRAGSGVGVASRSIARLKIKVLERNFGFEHDFCYL